MNDFSDTADYEWNLLDEAEGTDFEIDADATSFYMPEGNIVTFKAKALNGTPPFTFTWNFGDGTPEATGEMVKHQFTKPADLTIKVVGRDASGADSIVTMLALVLSEKEFQSRQRFNVEETPPERSQLMPPAPAPAATP